MQDEYQEIDLIQLIKVAFGRRKLMAVITAAAVVAGLVFFSAMYNPGREIYTARFTYRGAQMEEDTYIDGSAFKYMDLVSLDNLKAAQASDESLAGIDVDDIHRSSGINISQIKTYNTTTKELEENYFELTVKKKYFEDGNQAKAFLQALLSMPIDYSLQVSGNTVYDYALLQADNSDSFVNQIDFMKKQLAELDEKYNHLIEYYGDITLTDGDTITLKKNAMDLYFVNNSLDFLTYEREAYGYVKDQGNNISNLERTRQNLQQEYKYNSLELDMLSNSISSLMRTVGSSLDSAELGDYNSRVTKLITRNIEITKSIDNIDLQLQNIDNPGNKQFDEKLTFYRNVLEDYTEKYRAVESEALSLNAKLYFHDTSMIKLSGGMSTPKALILSAMLGLILACCVNCVLDYRKLFMDWRKEEENEENA